VTGDAGDDLEALVAMMRGPFLRTSRDRVAVIARLASALAIDANPAVSLARLVREAHTLKGGGGAFGFPSLSETAGRVEQAGQALLAHDESVSPDALHLAIADLQAVVTGLDQS
jgi:chemotaxis protein histidine kinase CheA